MVSNKKQKKSPEKSKHREDIDLNDLQVEVKQEEELIIEDAEQQHIQWRFIGLDDCNTTTNNWDCEEFQNVNSGNQIDIESYYDKNDQNINASFDQIMEISDDDKDIYKTWNASMLNDSGEVVITNEPLQDSLLESNGFNNMALLCVDKRNNKNSCSDPDNDKGRNHSKLKVDDIEVIKDIKKEKYINNANVNDKKTDSLSVGHINDYLSRKFMKLKCHLCSTVFQHSIYKWVCHIKNSHPKQYSTIQSKYKPLSDNIVFCKICKIQVAPKVNHTYHFITRHLEAKSGIFLCTFCDYSTCSMSMLQNHHKDNHDTVTIRRQICPKCGQSYRDETSLEFHFMSAHLREFNAKHIYKCHLCECNHFDNSRNRFLTHLIDSHKLSRWKTLNFRKIDNGSHFSCTKCFKIFTKTNIPTLLGHYLTHEDKSSWCCKYCKNSFRFKDSPVPHLCQAMRSHIEIKNKAVSELNRQSEDLSKCTPVTWQEFEAYIKHVCPYCNQEFDKFEDWRLHVRELHHIQTLEGLNMNILADDSDSLLCLECGERVKKLPIELHKHRFRHLPYKPYKCRHCGNCLPTYNKAHNHVQKNCNDFEENCILPFIQSSQSDNCSRPRSATPQEIASLVTIQCPLCNNKKFYDFSQVAKHISIVHGNFDKQFSKLLKNGSRMCKICQMEIKRIESSNLITHYLQHLNERPFKCQICLRSYTTYKVAVKHVGSYHLESIAIAECMQNSCNIKQEKEYSKPKVEIEENIEDSLVKEQQLKSKIQRAALVPTTFNPTANTPTPPPTPPTIVNLKKPETATSHTISGKLCLVDVNYPAFKTYEPFINFTCPECNENFLNYIKWENHIISKHSFYEGEGLRFECIENRKSKCTDCHTIVISTKSKQLHHKLTHMQYKPFICTLCSNHFSVVSGVYKHLRKTHFSEGSYKCDICNKLMSTDFDRLEHVKKAHPRKKWPSNICSICYRIPHNLYGHLQTNHLSYERPYRCNECGAYFLHPNDLESHTQKIHIGQANDNCMKKSSKSKSPLAKRKLRSPSADGYNSPAKKPCTAVEIATRRSTRKL